jgi:hypothetical protein
MIQTIFFVAAGLSAVGRVQAHGGIYNYTIGGANYTGYIAPLSLYMIKVR